MISSKQLKIAKEAIEKTYIGSCSISSSVKKIEEGQTKISFECICENQPCALSQKQLNSAEQTDINAKVDYTAKLFIAPEIVIQPGSKIIVVQEGRTYNFKASGKPFVYGTHQEIMLQEESNA